MRVGDRVIIPSQGKIPGVVWSQVEGRAGVVTGIADRGDVIVQFWDDRGSFQKRFRHHEPRKL